MARDLFIDLTNRRLAVSETNSAPAGQIQFTKGDNGAFSLYFLEATGIINRPFEVVTQPGTVKFGIGSRTGVPQSGTFTLTFDGDTTAPLPFNATAEQIQSAIEDQFGTPPIVAVSGSIDRTFTIRFLNEGAQPLFSADVSQLIPDTVAVIDERVAGSASVKEIQEIQLRLTPAVYQDSWADLSTTVTATIETTVTGSGLANEIQRLSFSQKPFAGTFDLTFPATAFTVSSAVTDGVFITTVTHGLALNQPIAITGFDTTITGYTRGQTYFVSAIPEVTQFTVSVTAGGTALTGEATTATTQGTINTFSRQTAPISASASVADVQAALQALDSIGAGGVIVTGIAGQFYDITFSGAKGLADQPELTVQNSTTAKPGKTADVNFATFALRDLIGNQPSVDLDLEIEITESGARSTVVLGGCSVSEELIDADSFSPVVGYPSFIFQALTAPALNATTELVPITGLDWTAQANSEYLVEWNLIFRTESEAGLNGRVSAPSGSSIYGKISKTMVDGSIVYLQDDLAGGAFFVENGGDINLQSNQKAYISTGVTVGTVSFQFAKDIAGITAVANEIQEGSWVRVEKVK
jgi:hypothetical protein